VIVNDSDSILARLMAVIEDRRANPSEQSYTTRLLNGGVDKIGGKILEEAAELVEAAREPGTDGRAHFIYEAADVLYHVLVLLGHREVRLDEVEAELARRFGVSGLEEKASRPTKPADGD
jgi:phosphoribosyl-ATP pyrophosphohydrolase